MHLETVKHVFLFSTKYPFLGRLSPKRWVRKTVCLNYVVSWVEASVKPSGPVLSKLTRNELVAIYFENYKIIPYFVQNSLLLPKVLLLKNGL